MSKDDIINFKTIIYKMIYACDKEHETIKAVKDTWNFWCLYWNSFLIHQKSAWNCPLPLTCYNPRNEFIVSSIGEVIVSPPPLRPRCVTALGVVYSWVLDKGVDPN